MKRFAAAAALLAVLAGSAAAVILPLRIPFQGKLVDPATNLPKNGSFSMTFKIWSAPTGGTQLFTETQNGVGVVNGVFSVQIGTAALLTTDVLSGASAYVGVTVVGDAGGEMTPRLPLGMAAYAYTSAQLVSDVNVRINPGVAYSTFNTAGSLLLAAGVEATTGSFSAQGNGVYSLFLSSGLYLSSGTLRISAASKGIDATGTGIAAGTGTFNAVGNAQYSITASSGINVLAGTLNVDATGGIVVDYGVVASTGLFRAAANGIYGLQVTSGVFVASGTVDVNGGGGLDVRYGVFAASAVFNGVYLSSPTANDTITADLQVVTVGNRSYVKLNSNNATSTNRTFCLTPGLRIGQVLILEWVDSGTNEGELADGAAACGGGSVGTALSAVWPATTNQPQDVITLIYDGNQWVETSRSAN